MNQTQNTVSTTNADLNRIPAVAIVPQQQQQQLQTATIQQQNVSATSTMQGVQSPLLMSPVESPRHSIILQPPEAESLQKPAFILGQVS